MTVTTFGLLERHGGDDVPFLKPSPQKKGKREK